VTQIVVNPRDLREMARLIREAASEIEDVSRSAGGGMPSMPPEFGPRVVETVGSASYQLRQAARSMYIESAHLDNRAAVAETSWTYGASFGVLLGLAGSRLKAAARVLHNAYRDLAGAKRFIDHVKKNIQSTVKSYNTVIRRWGNQYGHGRAFITKKMAQRLAHDIWRSPKALAKGLHLGPAQMYFGGETVRKVDAELSGPWPYKNHAGVDQSDFWLVSKGLERLSGSAAQASGALYTISIAAASNPLTLPVAAVTLPSAVIISGVSTATDLAHHAVDGGLKLVNYTTQHWQAVKKVWSAPSKLFHF
jgi:hypothetical protein